MSLYIAMHVDGKQRFYKPELGVSVWVADLDRAQKFSNLRDCHTTLNDLLANYLLPSTPKIFTR